MTSSELKPMADSEAKYLYKLVAETMLLEEYARGLRLGVKRKHPPQAHNNGPKNMPISQRTSSMRKHKGLAALKHMINLNVALIGVYESGATIAKGEAWAGAFATDMDTINTLWAGTNSRAKGTKIQRFYFIPQAARLLCLDIDNKNGKDGIKEFYLFCEKIGKPRHLLPNYLQDIPQSFPCYVSTPSGGFHLYFSYFGEKLQKKPLSPEAPGVEVIHGKPGITSPGSYKNGKPYILHGNIKNAPLFPLFILTEIEKSKKKPPAYIPHGKIIKDSGRPSWEKIREWTEMDGVGAGRNDRAFHLARHARNHGYTESETLDTLKHEPSLDGLPQKEIETTVKSAFSKRITA